MFQVDRIPSHDAGFLPKQPARGRRFSHDVAIIFSTSRLLLPAHRRLATLPSMNGLGTFIMIIMAAVLLALLGLLLARCTVSSDRLARHNNAAGYGYSATGVIFAVVLARLA